MCESPEQVLGTQGDAQVTCAEAAQVQGWIELLAGRPLQYNGAKRLPSAVAQAFQADPKGTLALVQAVQEAGRALEPVAGRPGAAQRSKAVWEAHADRGVVRSQHEPLWTIQRDALSVWAWDNDAQLAITESDIEGWLTYASLCREVQGGGVLRVSVADRVTAYRVLVDRFEAGSRDERLALVSLGPFWGQIQERWQAVPYERQQKWIAAAPLPPPMTATSLGYLQAVVEGSVVQHVASVHDVLGPFSLNRGPRVFAE